MQDKIDDQATELAMSRKKKYIVALEFKTMKNKLMVEEERGLSWKSNSILILLTATTGKGVNQSSRGC